METTMCQSLGEQKMEKNEYEELKKTADALQRNAGIQCSAEIQKAQNYRDGYIQGVEDLLKCVRRNYS